MCIRDSTASPTQTPTEAPTLSEEEERFRLPALSLRHMLLRARLQMYADANRCPLAQRVACRLSAIARAIRAGGTLRAVRMEMRLNAVVQAAEVWASTREGGGTEAECEPAARAEYLLQQGNPHDWNNVRDRVRSLSDGLDQDAPTIVVEANTIDLELEFTVTSSQFIDTDALRALVVSRVASIGLTLRVRSQTDPWRIDANTVNIRFEIEANLTPSQIDAAVAACSTLSFSAAITSRRMGRRLLTTSNAAVYVARTTTTAVCPDCHVGGAENDEEDEDMQMFIGLLLVAAILALVVVGGVICWRCGRARSKVGDSSLPVTIQVKPTGRSSIGYTHTDNTNFNSVFPKSRFPSMNRAPSKISRGASRGEDRPEIERTRLPQW
eukprot:TRINITY_DN933_c0_g1_i1.p1 TRINITY_DN933_c0_g1~~TRINITY_DN933_c0_g1_i1.p1  ORF type:complete len:382 (-),score=57.07 TRINITY_DN933_c0_g1_i1:440-1585(-)